MTGSLRRRQSKTPGIDSLSIPGVLDWYRQSVYTRGFRLSATQASDGTNLSPFANKLIWLFVSSLLERIFNVLFDHL